MQATQAAAALRTWDGVTQVLQREWRGGAEVHTALRWSILVRGGGAGQEQASQQEGVAHSAHTCR